MPPRYYRCMLRSTSAPGLSFRLLSLLCLAAFFSFTAISDLINFQAGQRGANKAAVPVSEQAMRYYSGFGEASCQDGDLDRCHEEKVEFSLKSLAKDTLEQFTPYAPQMQNNDYLIWAASTLRFGRWWQEAPAGECLLPGCPCQGIFPCFQYCSGRCPSPAGTPEKGFASAALAKLSLGPTLTDRRRRLETASVSYLRPLKLTVLLDLSASMRFAGGQTGLQNALDTALGIVRLFKESAAAGDRLHVTGFADEISFDPFGSLDWRSPQLAELEALILSGESGFIAGDSPSNLPRALEETIESILRDPLYSISENHIVLISAGLTFCQKTPFASVCPRKDAPPEEIYDLHLKSLQDAFSLLQKEPFLTSRIRFHAAQTAERAVPHSLLIPSLDRSGLTCMESEEKRRRNIVDVLWRSWTPPLSDPNRSSFVSLYRNEPGAYLQTNVYLFRAAQQSGGIWAPIRRSCPQPPYGEFPDLNGDGEAGTLHDYCMRSFGSGVPPARMAAGEEGSIRRYLVTDDTLVSARLLDEEGRLLCDPHRRSAEAQARSYFSTLFWGRKIENAAVKYKDLE